jgi:streptogramin lyase
VSLVLTATSLAAPLTGRLSDANFPAFRTPFDFAPGADGGIAVLEDLEAAVRLAPGGPNAPALAGVSGAKVLAADETGLLLVMDGNANVTAFRRGRESWRIKLQAGQRPARPVGLAARNGIFWVVDRNPARVLLYAYDGKQLAATDLKPWARSPFSIALGPSGEAFVTDPLGPAVIALTPAGSFSATLALEGTGVTRPTGVAVDPGARVWVSDGVTGVIVCIDPKDGAQTVRWADKSPRIQDPLRLGWARGALWILEGRAGRIKRADWEAP